MEKCDSTTFEGRKELRFGGMKMSWIPDQDKGRISSFNTCFYYELAQMSSASDYQDSGFLRH